MNNNKVSFTQYSNAIVAKAKNKRIVVIKREENILIELTNYNTDDVFQAVAYNKPRKNIHVNALQLTRQSAEALLVTLAKFLEEFEHEKTS